MANGDARNPSTVYGGNDYYADKVTPKRADVTTNAQAGGYYGGSGGNAFDRSEFVKVAGTKNVLDKNETQAKPLGKSGSTGW